MSDLLKSFEMALSQMEQALAESQSDMARDAAVFRFQLTFEMAWKAIQQFLRNEEIVCQSPKGCVAEAFVFGLIPDKPEWNDMAVDRNLSVHTCDANFGAQVYQRLPAYAPLLRGLLVELKKRSK